MVWVGFKSSWTLAGGRSPCQTHGQGKGAKVGPCEKLLLGCGTCHSCSCATSQAPNGQGSPWSQGQSSPLWSHCPSQDTWLDATPSLSAPGRVCVLARPQVPPESAHRFQIHQVEHISETSEQRQMLSAPPGPAWPWVPLPDRVRAGTR